MSKNRPRYDRIPRAGAVYGAFQHSQASKRESRQRNTSGMVFWLLILVSSVPWAALVLGWEPWQALAPGTRGSAYLCSAMLVASALSLLLSPEGHSSPVSRQDGERRSIGRDSGTIYVPSPRNEASRGASRAQMGSRYAAASAGKLATT
jgi:hypothetical protein